MIELKRCPICGNKNPSIRTTYISHNWYCSNIYCSECLLQLTRSGSTKEEAELDVINAWNRRHVPTCENIGDKNNPLHEVDQFVCSNCGLHLEDWVEVYYDDDWGFTTEPTYYDYALEYCPHCGYKVTDKDSQAHLK